MISPVAGARGTSGGATAAVGSSRGGGGAAGSAALAAGGRGPGTGTLAVRFWSISSIRGRRSWASVRSRATVWAASAYSEASRSRWVVASRQRPRNSSARCRRSLTTRWASSMSHWASRRASRSCSAAARREAWIRCSADRRASRRAWTADSRAALRVSSAVRRASWRIRSASARGAGDVLGRAFGVHQGARDLGFPLAVRREVLFQLFEPRLVLLEGGLQDPALDDRVVELGRGPLECLGHLLEKLPDLGGAQPEEDAGEGTEGDLVGVDSRCGIGPVPGREVHRGHGRCSPFTLGLRLAVEESGGRDARDRLSAVPQAELLVDRPQVNLDGALRHGEPHGDLLRAQPLRGPPNDLDLPRREGLRGALERRRGYQARGQGLRERS